MNDLINTDISHLWFWLVEQWQMFCHIGQIDDNCEGNYHEDRKCDPCSCYISPQLILTLISSFHLLLHAEGLH